MLVPAMHSTGTRSRSSTFSTPMCAAPRAPPPPRTRQVFAWATVVAKSSARNSSTLFPLPCSAGEGWGGVIGCSLRPLPSPPLRSRGGGTAKSEAIAQESSVDRDALAGDVRRCRQAQERDRPRDFFGFPDAAHRRAVEHF